VGILRPAAQLQTDRFSRVRTINRLVVDLYAFDPSHAKTGSPGGDCNRALSLYTLMEANTNYVVINDPQHLADRFGGFS
jgi:hypothetical protein